MKTMKARRIDRTATSFNASTINNTKKSSPQRPIYT